MENNQNPRVKYNCNNCDKESTERPSHYKRSKTHFCSMKCYKEFVKTLPFYKQNAYRGVRKREESKQIYHRNYCKNNPENISHLKARRYAREKNAKGSHTLKEWQDLKKSYRFRCAGCKKETKLTKDHIIPLSEGGTDYIENIQPLCRSCNSQKWKHIHENPELLEVST
jgi:5-methylcytosine-specific restriction endonuclease McrA